MDVILYFQPATQSSAPEKLAGVMEIAEKSRLHVQIIEERPTARRIRELIAVNGRDCRTFDSSAKGTHGQSQSKDNKQSPHYRSNFAP